MAGQAGAVIMAVTMMFMTMLTMYQ